MILSANKNKLNKQESITTVHSDQVCELFSAFVRFFHCKNLGTK
jgi:hypothetical protein